MKAKGAAKSRSILRRVFPLSGAAAAIACILWSGNAVGDSGVLTLDTGEVLVAETIELNPDTDRLVFEMGEQPLTFDVAMDEIRRLSVERSFYLNGVIFAEAVLEVLDGRNFQVSVSSRDLFGHGEHIVVWAANPITGEPTRQEIGAHRLVELVFDRETGTDESRAEPQPEATVPAMTEVRELGLVTAQSAPSEWIVEIPRDFAHVELGVHGRDQDRIDAYGGWQAEMTVNGRPVWTFLSYDDAQGGRILDRIAGSEVWENSGHGQWYDITGVVESGPNSIAYDHNTGGNGIVVEMRITTHGDLPAPE